MPQVEHILASHRWDGRQIGPPVRRVLWSLEMIYRVVTYDKTTERMKGNCNPSKRTLIKSNASLASVLKMMVWGNIL